MIPPVARSISDWQQQLDLEGSVTFRQSPRRLVLLGSTCVVFTAVCIWSWAVDGPSWWAVLGLLIFGAGGAFMFGQILANGVPTLTVTRTGLTRGRRREVAFHDIVEIITSEQIFGFTWTPRDGEQLRHRWERTHEMAYASIPVKGVADPAQLAQWILHLADPSGEIVPERRYAGMGMAWRLRSAAD